MPIAAPPRLSIILPTHGRHEAVAGLVETLAAQRRRLGASDVEIILIDDASAPALAAPPQEGVTLLRRERRGGAPAARRDGFRASRGAFVHFHDSDDGAPPFWLERLLRALEGAAPPDLLVTAREVHGEAGPPRRLAPRFVAKAQSAPERLRHYLLFENAIGPLGGVTFSRRAAERLTFPPLASCQDWHMYWEALGGPCRVAVDPSNHFLFHVAGADRISNSYRAKRRGMLGFARLVAESPAQRAFLRRYFDVVSRGAHDAKAGRREQRRARAWRRAALFLARRPRLSSRVFSSRVFVSRVFSSRVLSSRASAALTPSRRPPPGSGP